MLSSCRTSSAYQVLLVRPPVIGTDVRIYLQTWCLPQEDPWGQQGLLNSVNGLSLEKRDEAPGLCSQFSPVAFNVCSCNLWCKQAFLPLSECHLPSKCLVNFISSRDLWGTRTLFLQTEFVFLACFRWGEIPLALMQWRGSHFVLAAIDYYFLPLLLFSTPLLFNLLGNSDLITAKSGCFMSFIMCEVKYSFAKA